MMRSGVRIPYAPQVPPETLKYQRKAGVKILKILRRGARRVHVGLSCECVADVFVDKMARFCVVMQGMAAEAADPRVISRSKPAVCLNRGAYSADR